MRIVIIHYHLNPGGVTRIIGSQIKSYLKKNPLAEIILVVGNIINKEEFIHSNIKLIENPLFDYLEDIDHASDLLKNKYTEIISFLNQNIKKGDIIHVHNLNLGKNPLVSIAINQLASEGHKIVNHCHDFPEDRPQNIRFLNRIAEEYFKKDYNQIAYPKYSNFLYVVLNSYDMERVKKNGVNQENLFLLPNPVILEQDAELKSREIIRQKVFKLLKVDQSKIFVTYPVRVIKRKNIGELILIATFFSDNAVFNVTQPPKNHLEVKEYKEWQIFCRSNKINLIFETGLKIKFEELIAASDFCITTSIREGFGMTFLEPWLLGTPVIGRDIPLVTEDLVNEGVLFPALYERINVKDPSGIIDFKDLTICEQKEFIKKIISNDAEREEFMALNPFLGEFLKPIPKEIVENNKKIIELKYSSERYAERLDAIYRKFTY